MSRTLPHHPADDCVPDSTEHMKALGWTLDRPTGPATLAETRLRGRFGHLLMVRADRHGTESASVVLDEALNDARAAERARILAALPEALRGFRHRDGGYFALDATGDHLADPEEMAAALAAAIERVLA